jgi:GAF domain-containing protein
LERRSRASRRVELEKNLRRLRSSGRIKAISPPSDPDGTAAEVDPFQAMLPDLPHVAELEDLREEVRHLRRLHEVIHFLGGAPDLDALQAEVLDLALSVSDLRRGLLALASRDDDDGRPRFKVVASRGFDDQSKSAPETRVLRKILNHALESRQPLLEGNILEGGILGHAKDASLALGAVACVPLESIGGEGLVGALLIDDPQRRLPFSAAEQSLLRSFARHAAQAISRLCEAQRSKRRVARLQRRAERLEAERDAARTRLDQVARSRAGGAEALDRLLATPYLEAKGEFTERYVREALRRAGGDLRIAAQATGLPLARLIGLMEHFEITPERRPDAPRGQVHGEGTWGGSARIQPPLE